MGILTRRQGTAYVISSDHTADEAAKKHAAHRLNDVYQVWTGNGWSETMTEALLFDRMDDADEYVRAHYAKVRV